MSDALMKEIMTKERRIGALEERSRILTEINKANLPVGIWPLIRDIICPPKL